MTYKIIGEGFEREFAAPDNACAVTIAKRLAFERGLYSWILVDSDGLVLSDFWESPDCCK